MITNYDQPLGGLDRHTLRYLSLTKAYPQRHFSCDSCGQEYSSATFYSLAYHESELPYARVYCENCLQATPAGRQRLQPNPNPKIMPKLSKIRKKPKTSTKSKKLTNLPVKTKATKTSPIDYYHCLLTSAQNDWRDPSGQKKKITACCQDCKSNAPVLNKQREQAINQLVVSYHQVGASLKKLLKPIK